MLYNILSLIHKHTKIYKISPLRATQKESKFYFVSFFLPSGESNPRNTMPAKVLAGSLLSKQILLLWFFFLKNQSVILRATQKESKFYFGSFFLPSGISNHRNTMPAKVLAGSLLSKQILLLWFFFLKNQSVIHIHTYYTQLFAA